MKRVVLALCIFLSCVSVAFADDSAMAAIVADTVHVIWNGVVKTVTWADPVKGTKSEIAVIDAAKKTTHILVTSTTTLWDSDAKAIMTDKIVPRRHVNVIYLTTAEGVNVAKSIKILK